MSNGSKNLVYSIDRIKVRIDDLVTLPDGEEARVADFIPPLKDDISGRVYVRGERRGYRAVDASQIGAEWVSDSRVATPEEMTT